MSDVVIRAEGLGKAYQIRHEAEKGYTRFSEMLTERASRLLRRGGGPGVAQTRETFWALRDVSFEIREGEVVGIIGRNGAGKSTLLKVLSRITEPTEGRVEIRGRVASLLEVGTGFHPELTGRENIYLNGAILGMSRAEIRHKFDEIVDFAGVERFLDTPVKRYSSGMYVRLAFAVAAHLEPEILVVDEVLAVGDAEFQRKCLGKMGEVAKGGRTVLFVSHNMAAVRKLCQHSMVLQSGTLLCYASSAEVGILRYLGLNGEGHSPTIWTPDAPSHDPNFVATRLEVRSAAPNPTSVDAFRNDYPIEVVVEGRVMARDPALSVGFCLYSADGEVIFRSSFTDADEDRWPRLYEGPVRLRTAIPSRLLNEGTYRLELIADLHYRRWIHPPGLGIATVQFSIQGGLSESPYWTYARPGAIAPVLEWRAERLDAIAPMRLVT